MASERVQRQIDRLLDEADDAIRRLDWNVVRDRAEAALALQRDNADALAYLTAAQEKLGGEPSSAHQVAPVPTVAEPRSFCDGRYEVKRFLGEGGKKRVFLCHDAKLDRDVAFALIKTDGLNAEGEARIRREAQAMGKLGDHQHIVPVYDVGEEGGRPYLVTQLMGGGDVEGLIEKAPDHRVPLETALRIAEQVCQGLEYAHSKGIVHRDLKPGNAWLTADGTAKLGDFGLAVALDRSRLTQAGMMVGTVSYMPPEQAIGGEVTPRSDLYSLGAMLYEMVCGRPPFVGDESVAIITQHLNTPPVAPSWHVPDLPTGLEALILRLLEKDPSRRPASASEVREAVASIALGQSLGAESETSASAPAVGPADPLYSRTFVGREQELRQLQSAYDAALSGDGSLAMLVGEPGIGKTSLCEQLATYVAVRGGKVLVGHCYEEGSLSLPYLPFVEAMRSYVLTREPDDLRRDLGSGAAEVARLVSEIRDRLQVELRPAGDPEDDRWRLLQAVSAFLRNASTMEPLVIVLEDLHDADRGTIDLLLHLSRNIQGARVLVVGTYRDVEVDRSHPLSSALAELRRAGSFLRVPLRGLTVDEVQRMMSIVRGQDVPWSRAEAIHRQTEGNPLFVQEVLRYLVEEGIVVREGGRYLLSDAEAGIPEGLRDVVGKRLSRLSEKANQILSIASVVGREFQLDVLQRVAGLPEEELYVALEEATDRAVVEQRQAVGTVGFRFTHAFFRQTLYEEIFVPRRIRLHQQVGKALEEVYGRRLEEHAAELAEHFVQSTEPGDLEKALSFSRLAAQRAMQVFAYSEAVRHLEQALRTQEVLDPADQAGRCDLLLALGEALMPAGEPGRVADEVAEEAVALAEALHDPVRAARACRLAVEALARAAGRAASREVRRRWAERADRYAAPDSADRVYADLALAPIRQAAGRTAEAEAFKQGALALARRLDDPDTLFYAAGRNLLTSWSLRDAGSRIQLARECAAWPRAGVRARVLGEFLRNGGFVLLDWGERAGAEALWRELMELALRTHDVDVAIRSLQPEVILAILDGRLEEALATATRIVALGEETGSPDFARLFALFQTVRPLLYLGRAEEALPVLASSASDDVSRCNHAVALAHLGRRDEAQAIVHEMIEERWADRLDEAPVNCLANLLEAAVLVEDQETAQTLARTLEPIAELASVSIACTCAARHLGAAAMLIGDRPRAISYYDLALVAATKVRNRPETALTRLALAELLLEHYSKEKTETQEHLDFAIAEFREMKMQPALERALGHKGLLKA